MRDRFTVKKLSVNSGPLDADGYEYINLELTGDDIELVLEDCSVRIDDSVKEQIINEIRYTIDNIGVLIELRDFINYILETHGDK